MSFSKTRQRENKEVNPGPAKSLIKMQARSTKSNNKGDQEFLKRCNELGNRARRSFQNDGPGGNYEGF